MRSCPGAGNHLHRRSVPSVFSRTTRKSTPSLYGWTRLERPQVHVEIEREAHLQQQAALEHAGRHVGRADRAEQDRVVAAQLVEHRVGQDVAGREVAAAAEVVVGRVERDAGGAHDLQRLGGHFGPDAVAADDPDPVGHARSSSSRCSARKNRPRKRGRLRANAGAAFAYGMTITSEKRTGSTMRVHQDRRNHTACQTRASRALRTAGRVRVPCPDERAAPLAAGVRALRTRARRALDHAPPRDLPVDRAGPRARRHQENADYDAAKNEQGHNEARIRQLEAMLKNAVVIESSGERRRRRARRARRAAPRRRRRRHRRTSSARSRSATRSTRCCRPKSPLGQALLGAAPGATGAAIRGPKRELGVTVVSVRPH